MQGVQRVGVRQTVKRETVAQEPGTDVQQDRECATTSAAVSGEPSQTSVEGEGEQEEMNIDELLNGEEKRVVDDENVFKVPCSKRKTRKELKGVKPKKMPLKKKAQVQKSDTDYFLTLTVSESLLIHPFLMVRKVMDIVSSKSAVFWN